MQVYFEDGAIKPYFKYEWDFVIDARDGFTSNEQDFNYIKETQNSRISTSVYTNSLVPLLYAGKYCWDDDTKTFELYMRKGTDGHFTRIDELTQRELRIAHNIFHMYSGGEFRN